MLSVTCGYRLDRAAAFYEAFFLLSHICDFLVVYNYEIKPYLFGLITFGFKYDKIDLDIFLVCGVR